MESKFDYLTLTIKPEEGSGHNLWDCLNVLRKFLLLDDLFDKMTDHGRCRFKKHMLGVCKGYPRTGAELLC